MQHIPYPYYLYSAEQCRTMDEKTISEFGIDGFTLMEIAGTRAADFIQTKFPEKAHGLFFCGKGNNAGDALVVARLLSQKDYQITVCFVSGTENLSADTQGNLELLNKLDANVTFMEWGNSAFGDFDFIVDGMLGTGLNSEVRPPYPDVIEWINQQKESVFALDIPSGLDATNGNIFGSAVKADFTLTFGALKTGFYLNDGFDLTGEIILCELPFPNKYKHATAYLIDEEWVEASSPSPQKREHKYDGGVLYIIGGSEGLTGAAILTAKSAWAAGIGAVVLITPKGLLEVYEKNLIQIIKKPVGSSEDTSFTEKHLDEVNSILAEKPGKVIIGPGLGRSEETVNFTRKLLQKLEGDTVIDADALFALSKADEWKKPVSANWILTPHPGELSSLFKSDVNDGFHRMALTASMAKEKQITILAKGLPSFVGTVESKTYLTGYDTRIFSRAGFGDVLAGKIGAFWLQYQNPEFACFHALLDGHKKAANILKENGVP